MTGTTEERVNPPAEETPAPSVLSGSERAFVRLTLWQTVLSVVGVFIAVVALYAALVESEAVRRQTAAAVWPFVQLGIEDFDTGDSAEFTLSLTNAGVGPARMNGIRLTLEGRPMRNWEQVVTLLDGTFNEKVGRSSASDRVLSPGERVDMIKVSDPDLARRFQSIIADPEISLEYCYCSIFSECWLASSQRDIQNPEPVEACPDFGETGFSN